MLKNLNDNWKKLEKIFHILELPAHKSQWHKKVLLLPTMNNKIAHTLLTYYIQLQIQVNINWSYKTQVFNNSWNKTLVFCHHFEICRQKMTVISNLNKKPVTDSVELLHVQKNDSHNWRIPEKKVLVLIIFLMTIVIISLGMSFAVVNYPNVSGK